MSVWWTIFFLPTFASQHLTDTDVLFLLSLLSLYDVCFLACFPREARGLRGLLLSLMEYILTWNELSRWDNGAVSHLWALTWAPGPAAGPDLPSTWWSILCWFLRRHRRQRAPPQELQWDSDSRTLSPHAKKESTQTTPTHTGYNLSLAAQLKPLEIPYRRLWPALNATPRGQCGNRATKKGGQRFSCFVLRLVAHSQMKGVHF